MPFLIQMPGILCNTMKHYEMQGNAVQVGSTMPVVRYPDGT